MPRFVNRVPMDSERKCQQLNACNNQIRRSIISHGVESAALLLVRLLGTPLPTTAPMIANTTDTRLTCSPPKDTGLDSTSNMQITNNARKHCHLTSGLLRRGNLSPRFKSGRVIVPHQLTAADEALIYVESWIPKGSTLFRERGHRGATLLSQLRSRGGKAK